MITHRDFFIFTQHLTLYAAICKRLSFALPE